MKETVNVNIGSVAFILDEDAYRVLGSYFDDIRRRLPEGDAETMGDIEARVAEIFRERVASPMRVITLDVVRATMAQMGSPADFGEPRGAERSESAEGGTGTESAEQPPLLILFGGLSIWAYIILWIVIPEEPARKFNINSKNR